MQGRMLTPSDVAQLEPLAPPPVQKLLAQAAGQPASIVMGASLAAVVSFVSRACCHIL